MNVPDGWQLKTLEQIAHVERGKFSARPRNDPKYYGGDIPFVQTGDVTASAGLLTTYSQTLNEQGLAVSKLFPKHTTLVTIAANIGDTAFTTFELACPDSLVGVKAKKNINARWLFYFLQTRKSVLDSFATQNAQKNINLQVLKPLEILVPPLEQQNKIAEILSTWDGAIEKLEQLIAAKQRRKHALMQQLLTGKVRFREFEGQPWLKVRLSDIATVQVSPIDKKTKDDEPRVRVCNYMDVYQNRLITQDMDFMEATATPKQIQKFSLKQGDVIITKDSESPDDIAIPAFVPENLQGVVCGYHLAILRLVANKIDSVFLYYLLCMPRTRYYFSTLANGATRFGLTIGAIQKASFEIPQLLEQKKIAAVLSTADDEIAGHQRELAALRTQKRGLMQQLLTGKTRVMV